jgi:hypothetical protein
VKGVGGELVGAMESNNMMTTVGARAKDLMARFAASLQAHKVIVNNS